jgi:hypothetical protein
LLTASSYNNGGKGWCQHLHHAHKKALPEKEHCCSPAAAGSGILASKLFSNLLELLLKRKFTFERLRTGSVLLFSCINEAFYRGCKKDLTRNNESADGVVGLSATIRRFNEAFQFGMPNDVAGFLGPFGWEASADGAVKDVKNVYKVRTPSALQRC